MNSAIKKRFITGTAAFAMLLAQLVMPAQVALATHEDGYPHGPNPGTIKVRDIADDDDLPQNDPMLSSCSLVVEFYNFDNLTNENASVIFSSQAPTADATITVSGDTQYPVIPGDGGSDGEGVADEDGEYTYTLAFTGEPKTTGNTTGYHVDVDVKVDGTRGGTKSKTFWMPASCRTVVPVTVTPDITIIDECETENDMVSGVVTTGISYNVTQNGLEYTVVASATSGDYELTAGNGFTLNQDGTATRIVTLTDVACEAEPLPVTPDIAVVDECETENDTVSGVVTTGISYTVTPNGLQYTVVASVTSDDYELVAGNGFTLNQDGTATRIVTLTDVACESPNICTVTNNLFDSEWQYDDDTYPVADGQGTYNFEPTGLYLNTPVIDSYVYGLINAGDTPLADVDALSYKVLRLPMSAGYESTLPAYILLVDTNGPSVVGGMKYFFYEPYYNDASRAAVEGVFQVWDAYDGGQAKWYVSGTGQALRSWDSLVSEFDDAVVLAYGFNQGTYNAETYSAVQDITFDCATTSFTNEDEGGSGGGGNEEPEVPVTPVTPTTPTPVIPTLPVGGQGSALPDELPLTGTNGSILSTWIALLVAVLTYGAVYYLQPKKRFEQ